MNETMKQIKKYIEDNLNKFLPEIEPKDLYDNGAVYYMNGNDGTDFDWDCNERTCEFMAFYPNEWGVCKVYVTRDGEIVGYAYKEQGRGETIKLPPEEIGETIAKEFYRYLYREFDKQNKWDSEVFKIN